MTQELIERLEPCPFCGSTPSSRWMGCHENGDEGYWDITCPCGQAIAHEDDEETAIARWNTRDQSQSARIAELEGLLLDTPAGAIAVELLNRVATMKRNWEALERIIGEVYVETDGPDRVRWEGVWYDGPLATAYLRTMKVIQKLARASLTKDSTSGGSDAN